MKEKVLVTGGAGYIGSILVEKLLQKKFHVTVLDNFTYTNLSLSHLFNYKNLDVVNLDIRDKSKFKKYLNQSDIIIPLAALVGAPLCDLKPNSASHINVKSNLFMLDNLSKNQKLIMPTSNSAYGVGDKNNFCDENSKLTPLSKYAKDKVIIEKKVMRRTNSISLRLATVFGVAPRMRVDLLVNDFVYKSFFDGYLVLFEPHFKRNYIHVRDVAKAIIHMIENFNKNKQNIFNVGLSNANLSKLELANRIKKFIPDLVIKIESFKKDKDKRNYIVSNKKIEKTGFKPNHQLNDGIRELIRYFSTQKKFYQGNV